MFADLAAIEAANNVSPPTQDYLDFGEFEGRGGTPAKDVTVTFNAQSSQRWQRADGAWTRVDQDNFVATTLLVLKVQLSDAGYKDSAGSSVPIVETTGRGEGWLATGDSVFSIRWAKASDTSPFELSTADGTPLKVPVGRTWISLVPEDTGKVQVS